MNLRKINDIAWSSSGNLAICGEGGTEIWQIATNSTGFLSVHRLHSVDSVASNCCCYCNEAIIDSTVKSILPVIYALMMLKSCRAIIGLHLLVTFWHLAMRVGMCCSSVVSRAAQACVDFASSSVQLLVAFASSFATIRSS